MAECSYCTGMPGPRTFAVKARCSLCPNALCDSCAVRPLCVACQVAAHPFLSAQTTRLRATCVLLEGEHHGALQNLSELLFDAVQRDYARWRLRRPGQPIDEWLRLCQARLLSMDRAPSDLPCHTLAVLRWLCTAPPDNGLVHPQEPVPRLPSDDSLSPPVVPPLWVPTLIDGQPLANPRLCGGCLYHPKAAAVAAPVAPQSPEPVPNGAARRDHVERAVEAVRHSELIEEELAAIREQRRIGEALSRGLDMDL